MNNADSSTSRLLDIVLPPVPPEAIDYSSIFIIFVSVSLAIAALSFKLYQSGFKHKVLISLLKRELESAVITPKQAAYRLAGILQSAHKTGRLTGAHIGISVQQQTTWLEFVVRLSDYRYSAHEISQADVLSLMDDAKSWVMRSRP